MKIRNIFVYLIGVLIGGPIAFLLITTFILSRYEKDEIVIEGGIGYTMVNNNGNPDLAVEKGIGSSDQLYKLVTVGNETFAEPYQKGQSTADILARCKYTLSWYSGPFETHSGGLVNARDLINKENCKPVDAPN